MLHPGESRIFEQATPAAPTPETTTVRSSSGFVHQLQCVEQRGEHYHRRAVLVVMEDRDIQLGFQPVFNLKAARRGNILQIDAAEGGRQRFHRRDDLFAVFCRQADGKGIDTAELLEEHALPSITGMAASGPISPRPNTAVPSVTTATVLRLMVR